ncbi:MAG: glycosyl transferase family 1 [Candidatus Thermofonsia Clade 1 bacterium]|uniref:Glycosyl transferase family 1 n=1 Tax=Candidatus Thermofonsia Clade 1 bacterium TaxID=2364210 RepID=A0A2M8Q050_9CHLR|nr:MAG: glycosyl transferase family 1 [Candidatus Thermofonsia Clade 1 bacterium]
MRILFLTSQVPYPPYSGGALRVYGLLNGLHKAGYQLDLLTFSEPNAPPLEQTPLAALCNCLCSVPYVPRSARQRLRDLLLTPHADLARRFDSPAFATALREQLGAVRYDVVHIQSLEMATYLPILRAAAPQTRLIYDAYNAEYALQRSIYSVDRRQLSRLPQALYSFIQWRRLLRFERAVCREVDTVIAVSEADAAALRKLVPEKPIEVVPNGIFTADYAQPSAQLNLGDAALLFTGTMNYRPNVDAVLWFVDHVLDRVRQAVPTVRLFIVGNKPHARLETIRQRPDVEITGFVQDVAPFLHAATIYIAPLRMGSGTRLKLLQAMAVGCPIVSTSIGAQGLALQNGREAIIADDALSFAQAIIGLLKDPARRAALGAAARQLAQARYDWSAILPCLLRVYERLGFERISTG